MPAEHQGRWWSARTGHGAPASALMVLALTGCHPPQRTPLDPLAMDQAVAIVNANASAITTGLKATGSVRGYFTDRGGRRRHFDLIASLQFLAPRNLYVDLKNALGGSELVLGSNDTGYWLHLVRDGDSYRHGTHAAAERQEAPAPALRPDMVVEALGLNGVPPANAAWYVVQRIEDEYQQLIFVAPDDNGPPRICREYWLDRFAPRLTRRILFRDAWGRIQMDSLLDDYRALGDGGPLLPRRVQVAWPRGGAELRFDIHRWRYREELTPDHPAFVPPHERGQRFENEIDLDVEYR